MMKRPIPTTRKIKMYSECCNSETVVLLTNQELWSGVFIQQWCEKCKLFSAWKARELY